MAPCTCFDAPPRRRPKPCTNPAAGQILTRSFPTLVWADACAKHVAVWTRAGKPTRPLQGAASNA